MRRRWTVHVPNPGVPLLTSNQRLHWAQRSRRTRLWREAAWAASRALRERPVERAWVVAVVHYPATARRRDVGNAAPTVKACVDGALTDAGVLADDDDTHLIGPDLRAGHPAPRGVHPWIDLIITELTDEETVA